jgi:hypothetical protein
MTDQIVTKTVYSYNGVDYSSLYKVKLEVENSIGALIDSIHPRLPSKQALAAYELLTRHSTREKLVKLLQVEHDIEDECCKTISGTNVLDLE